MGPLLYFVNGVPTPEQTAEAAKAGAAIRNAQAWHDGDFLEECAGVMGDPEIVPPPYRPFIIKARAKPEVPAKPKKAKHEPDS